MVHAPSQGQKCNEPCRFLKTNSSGQWGEASCTHMFGREGGSGEGFFCSDCVAWSSHRVPIKFSMSSQLLCQGKNIYPSNIRKYLWRIDTQCYSYNSFYFFSVIEKHTPQHNFPSIVWGFGIHSIFQNASLYFVLFWVIPNKYPSGIMELKK